MGGPPHSHAGRAAPLHQVADHNRRLLDARSVTCDPSVAGEEDTMCEHQSIHHRGGICCPAATCALGWGHHPLFADTRNRGSVRRAQRLAFRRFLRREPTRGISGRRAHRYARRRKSVGWELYSRSFWTRLHTSVRKDATSPRSAGASPRLGSSTLSWWRSKWSKSSQALVRLGNCVNTEMNRLAWSLDHE
jgi:hypothetical protein